MSTVESVRESATGARVPTQARGRRTRAALLSAAEREFGERGHAGTTARSIAERAGVATGSFYQYFRDKDAVLHELAGGRFAQLAASLAEVPSPASQAGLRQTIERVVDYHRKDRALHGVLTERRHADPELDRITRESEARFIERISALLSAPAQAGPAARDVQADAFVLFGLIEGAVHAHVFGGATVSDARFTDALVDAVARLTARDGDAVARLTARDGDAVARPTARDGDAVARPTARTQRTPTPSRATES